MANNANIDLNLTVEEFIDLKIAQLKLELQELNTWKMLKQSQNTPASELVIIEGGGGLVGNGVFLENEKRNAPKNGSAGKEVTDPRDPNFIPSQRTVKPLVLDLLKLHPDKWVTSDWVFDMFLLSFDLSFDSDKRREWVSAISSSFNSLTTYKHANKRKAEKGRGLEYKYPYNRVEETPDVTTGNSDNNIDPDEDFL